MTEPLYAPSARRTRVLGAQGGEYAGSADRHGYWLDLQYLLWRISTVQWEDIDPDFDPRLPCKPTHRYTHHDESVVDLSVIDLDSRIPEWEHSDWGTPRMELERQKAEAAWDEIEEVLDSMGIHYDLETADNYERLLVLEAGMSRYGEHWSPGQLTVTLVNQAGANGSVPAHRAMWLLLTGSLRSTDVIYRECGLPGCTKPSHLANRREW